MNRLTMNVTQVRELLGSSRQHVYNLFHRGALDGFFHGEGKGLRIYRESLQNYLDSQKATY